MSVGRPGEYNTLCESKQSRRRRLLRILAYFDNTVLVYGTKCVVDDFLQTCTRHHTQISRRCAHKGNDGNNIKTESVHPKRIFAQRRERTLSRGVFSCTAENPDERRNVIK